MRPELTARQEKVLQLRAEGFSGPQIAAALHLAVATVSYHETVIVHRLNARNITHAVFLACRSGILDGRPQRHGDHAGYQAHIRRGEDPKLCPPCWAGERAYRNGAKVTRTEAPSQNRPEKALGGA
ncbi:LuxR C-terminal-related transcriptional regulator [Streptomyces sp. NPDC006339]|uniref:helix-turn-helix domain-containing protein n=1 Tax=Streptomyces sp. NPDC006339 TaxID=3156755 RepID=UPI0033ACCDCF